MSKIVRGYERQDFSDLLDRLHNPGGEVGYVQLKPRDIKKETVSLAVRMRSSLMDDPKMLFAYSVKRRVLHDRDCECVRDIPDKDFKMTAMFIENMKHCPLCYRKALIRCGVGADRKRIGAYVRFFETLGVSNKDLQLLMLVHKAQLNWISNDIMQIRLSDDTWQVVKHSNKLELRHNNYICLEDFSRYFTGGFHRQAVYDRDAFHFLLEKMCSYSWDRHVEMLVKTREDKVPDDVEVRAVCEDEVGVNNEQEVPLVREGWFMRLLKWIWKW